MGGLIKALRSAMALVFAGSVLVACGGDSPTDAGSNDSGGNTSGENTREILTNPAFGANIQEIFSRRGCASANCHGTSALGSLTLTSGSSYTSLVNIDATGDPSKKRVTPNDAQNSYLVMKVEGRAGDRMPLGLGTLDNIDIANIRNWIDTGAPNN